jgi:hypothetical protein
MKSVLLIDDTASALDDLARTLEEALADKKIAVTKWSPRANDTDPLTTFESKIDHDTVLVVTDADLTSQGSTGLFGPTIISWCQSKPVPVGEYTRKLGAIPKAPNFFELRIPATIPEAVCVISGLAHGFLALDDAFQSDSSLLHKPNPAAILAAILGDPSTESQLALYATRLATASGALVDRLELSKPTSNDKRLILIYIIGHFLLTVLRFPGPIVHCEALKAYLAISAADTDDALSMFESARYVGPFCELRRFYWIAHVDAILESISLPADDEFETIGESRRVAIETKTGEIIPRPTCPRCDGKNGGFFCPFTERTVCERPDCSVAANSWLPQGASLCRIERDFYDEWAPILGL